jgi:hypothetical protein
MAMKQITGAISELEALEYIENNLGPDWTVVRNKDGGADFTATNHKTKEVYNIESKRCSTSKINFQRAIRDKKYVRLYGYDFCDILCVDRSDYSGNWNDFHFINTSDLPPHSKYEDKIKPDIEVSKFSKSLNEAIKIQK